MKLLAEYNKIEVIFVCPVDIQGIKCHYTKHIEQKFDMLTDVSKQT